MTEMRRSGRANEHVYRARVSAYCNVKHVKVDADAITNSNEHLESFPSDGPIINSARSRIETPLTQPPVVPTS